MTGLRNLWLAAVVAMVPMCATTATPAPSAAVRAACTTDAKRLCGAVIGNPEARRKCMIAHRAQLSEACKAAIADDKKAPGTPGAGPAAAGSSEPTAQPPTSDTGPTNVK
jgi:hypothetical protein